MDLDDHDIELLADIKKDEVIELFYKHVHHSSKERAIAVVQLQSQCAPLLPDLATVLKSKVGEVWKQLELPEEKLPSSEEIEKFAEEESPVSAFMNYFEKSGLIDVWTDKGVEGLLTEQVKLASPIVANDNERVINDVSLFKSLLEVTSAPVPINDLSIFKESSPKL